MIITEYCSNEFLYTHIYIPKIIETLTSIATALHKMDIVNSNVTIEPLPSDTNEPNLLKMEQNLHLFIRQHLLYLHE